MTQSVDSGLWQAIINSGFANRPGLFVDRDGVIVEDCGYLGRVEDVRLIAGAAKAIARCNRAGIPIVIVTNQSGVGRGYYGWDGFRAVQSAITAALAAEDSHVDAIFACAYHPDALSPYGVADHPWRKPNPGMILAARPLGIDLSRSWIVGDRADDLAAGAAAGLMGGVLVSGGARSDREVGFANAKDSAFVTLTASSLADAVGRLTVNGQLRA